MRYAVISDIHSNIEAFQAVVKYLETNSVDRIACLGDITGYGPDPKACIELFKSLKNSFSTAGNHDLDVTGKLAGNTMNDAAKKSAALNREALGPSEIVFLNTLRHKVSENGLLFLHGSPRDPINEYLFTLEKYADNMSSFTEQVCFTGHTHQPIIFHLDTVTGETGFIQVEMEPFVMTLEDTKRYIINAGSVGQPRDRNPKACMAFYDTETKTISFKRLDYNTSATAEKMTRFGYPAELAGRLVMGI